MHFSIMKFAVVAIASALFAVLGIFRDAFRTGEDPSDDGPRALIAEFIGFWAGAFLLIWSFMVEGRTLQWTLRGIGAVFAVAGILLASHFAETTEVPETPDKEPTGFKNDSAGLHLE